MSMVIYKSSITAYCSDAVYHRAENIVAQGKILDMFVEKTETGYYKATATIHGSMNNTYKTYVKFYENDDLGLQPVAYSCDCPAMGAWGGICKHATAVCIAYKGQLALEKKKQIAESMGKNPPSSSEIESIFKLYSAVEENAKVDLYPGDMHIEPYLSTYKEYGYHYGEPEIYTIEIRAGAARLYVIKDIPQFIHAIVRRHEYSFGKLLSARLSEEMFDDYGKDIIKIMTSAVREVAYDIDSDSFFTKGSAVRALRLSAGRVAELIETMYSHTGKVEIGGKQYTLVQGNPELTLHMKLEPQGGATLSFGVSMKRISAEPNGYFAIEDTIYHTTQEFQKLVVPFLTTARVIDSSLDERMIFLSEADYSRFCAIVMPRLKDLITIDEGEIDFEPYMPKVPVFQFYLSASDSVDGGIEIRSEVSYGAATYPLEQVGREYRNVYLEKPALDLVCIFFNTLLPNGNRIAQNDDDLYALLETGLDALREIGEVYIDNSLKNLRYAPQPKVNFGVSLSGDLIDISVSADGFTPSEINEIIGAYRMKKRYTRLKSGEFLSLDEGDLATVAELSEGLDIVYDKNGKAKTSSFRAQYIDSVISREDSTLNVNRNTDFKRQIRALRNYKDSDYEIPTELRASLRGYQQAGFRWLCTLADCGLGGILSDDMGLGKTVQMLAYILHQGGRTLVVCPASLLYNWENEAKKFAPTLETHIIHGTPEQRATALKAQSGILITSYDQLRRDLILYEKQHFDCCVLDEAQYIRNAATKAAKAVKLISCTHRFALTGTPIENRLSDLWSIFDFLMPGYFYKYETFRKQIETKAVDGDNAASARLTKMSTPFILRRRKKDVLKELPDKVESVLSIEMAPEQEKLYKAQEQALRYTLQKADDAELLHRKIEVLAALTRLRQLCCTPELYLENYNGGSGKVDACLELLREATESGHKTLVFSQFTTMLELLLGHAQASGLNCLYLSGKNTAEQRRDMVNAFQNGAATVFFISLKAGGTGLNLTAADRVIHFDPWWNFAAEEQATDRTHRIGQKNTVFVTKLVCKGTIEERILDLQDRKRELSNLVMNSDSIGSGNLDREELMSLLSEREDD